jgi:HAD superfamily hydrolase (TIGR01549 family)
MTHLLPRATDGPVRAIFFDFDGTLLLPQPNPVEAFVQFATTNLGLTITPDSSRQLKLWAHHYWSQDEQIVAEREALGQDGFWLSYSQRLLRQVAADTAVLDQAQAVRDWFYNAYEPEQTLVSGINEVLTQLQETGYRLGLITNRFHPVDEEIQQLGLTDYFELVLAAGEVGVWKPNSAIFDHALSHFDDLSPADCLYIGDNYYADGLGAQRAGWLPVLFDPDALYTDSDYHRLGCMTELPALLANLT